MSGTTARFYTGIGSRETPRDICRLFTWVGERLNLDGWVLRSGAADGADAAFEGGAKSSMAVAPAAQIYLPWPGFNDHDGWLVELDRPQPAAFEIAAQFHPAWDRLSRGARALHARNAHQLLGPDVTNPVLSSFIICWTKDAAGGGGTGQALRMARHYGVPIFDAATEDVQERLSSLIGPGPSWRS